MGNTESMKQKRPELVRVTRETMQPQRRDSCAVGKVCSYAEEIRIKPLETVGVVRDNAVTGQVKSEQNHMSGNATYQALGPRDEVGF